MLYTATDFVEVIQFQGTDATQCMEQINIQIWELQGSAKKCCFLVLSFILSSQGSFHQSATNACSNTVNSVVIRRNVTLGILEPSKECFRPFTTTTVPRILNARTQLKLNLTRLFMTRKKLDENCLALKYQTPHLLNFSFVHHCIRRDCFSFNIGPGIMSQYWFWATWI